jgi:uncharacterized protein YoxC
MSDQPRDLTLERVNRLTQALADLMEGQTQQGRMLLRVMTQISSQLDAIKTELTDVSAAVRELASEQVLLGNRVESAFSCAMRTNIRLDELEDTPSTDRD